MKIYQDVFSNEEIISDSYEMVQVFDGVAVEVKSRMVVKGEQNVDIGCGNAFGGKNQQGEDQQGQNPVEKVNLLVDTFHYEETSFDKPGFQAYFKGYMKKVLEYLTANKPERVQKFKAGGKELFKWILATFDEFTFYTPSTFDMENLIVFSYYKKEEDEAPTFVYIMDGLKFYKV